MKITIATVCYNAASEILPTLESIAGQTYNNIEFLVIDGASTDDTLTILEDFKSYISVLESEPDKGIYDAMNKALRMFKGDAIIFMNAGDYFHSPMAVELAADFMRENQNVDVAYGGLEVRPQKGNVSQFMPPPESEALEFLIEGSLPHQATFAKRSAFARTGLFDTAYRSHADYDWFLKVATDPKLTLKRMPFVVASFGLGGASSNLEKGERERHAVQNKTPLLQRADWLQKRIEIYQEIYLRQRLELERLRD